MIHDEPYIITANRQLWAPPSQRSLHKVGSPSTCTEQFPGPRSWIRSGISLDYSLWWPLRVLSWGYLKRSAATLRAAQRRLQGFGCFERFKVQAFRALITHWELAESTVHIYSWWWKEVGYFVQRDLFFLMAYTVMLISLHAHFLPRTVR